MKRVRVVFDGKEVWANEGEILLDVARKNNIFIPAICYLKGASANLACRLCMVKIDGKIVYACNYKIKDDIEVQINEPELNENRKRIMMVYDVNHPLECGVCDKSGCCELQNYTYYMNISSKNMQLKRVIEI